MRSVVCRQNQTGARRVLSATLSSDDWDRSKLDYTSLQQPKSTNSVLNWLLSRNPSAKICTESRTLLIKGEDVTDRILYEQMLAVALEEARLGLAEGGIPIGAALFTRSGELVSRGRNRRVQQGDPSMHGETDAFRRAGRQRSYRNLVMVTTLAPCWYCSGLVRQFRIGAVVVGESRTFTGGIDWLRKNGVEVIDLDNDACREMLQSFIVRCPEIWNEDIGEE